MASLLSRKLDLLYFVFFLTHIPIMLLVDLYPLYPNQIVPAFMTGIRKWYITTYDDQFFIKPPAWFITYMWLEAMYHFPISIWAVGALYRNDPKVPLHLLVFALEVAITTLTCVSDYLSWSPFSNEKKLQLGYLYVPYLALSVFMALDMIKRLDKIIVRAHSIKEKDH